jgi:hypothetical protein
MQFKPYETSMKKLFTQTAITLFLFLLTFVAQSQTTVNISIPCTGSTNPNSGRITNTGTTKSYGYLWHGVSQENRGWARFDLSAYNIPANATITAAAVDFWVETSSGAAGNNYLKFFTGNTGTMTAAQIWSAIGQAAAHEASNADLNPAGAKTRGINATGITFLSNNRTVPVNLGFTRGSGNFGFRIHGSDGVGQNSTDVNKRPVLRITYTIPCNTPAIPTAINGSANVCGIGNQSYSVNPVSGATGYTWSVSGGGSVSGGQGTANATINWTSAGTYNLSVTADTACASSAPRVLSVTVTAAVPGQPAAFTAGPSTVCLGQSNVTYTVPTVTGATSYVWNYSGTGATINGTGNSVTVSFSGSATPGTLSVAGNNACGAGTDRALSIAINTVPAQPGAFSAGPNTVCQGQSNVTYTVPAVSGATSYLWDYTGTGASISGTSESVSVNFSNSATSGSIRVFAQNACGNSASPQTIAVTVNPLPAQPGVFNPGPTPVCQGDNNITYTVPSVSGATSYTWAYSGTGAAISDNNNTASINFAANATAGILSVTANNGCGAGQSRTLSIAVNSTPGQPSAFTVSTATVCQGQNGVAYTVPAVSGATSYTWSYSGTGATINGSTNSVTINFAANATAGTLSVSAVNVCGTSTAQTTSIAINGSAPAQPGAFTTSTATICPSTNGVTYTVPSVSGATSYTWSYSGTGATINGSTNSVTIDFAANATAGTLSVTASNGCGTSTAQTTNINVTGNPPAQPGAFTTSTATVCPSQSGVAYAVPAVSGATSYTWSYSGTGATINGSTNSVTIDFAANATAGTLSVSAVNGCGTSTAQTTSVAINEAAPAQPGAFTTSTASVCLGTNGVVYTIPVVNGATSYNWSYGGTGATINGSTNSITIDFAANATVGTLSVTAQNGCGTSTAQTLPITLTAGSVPSQPTAFTTSSTTICRNTTAVVYEVVAVNGATSYNWTYSGTGATINGNINSVTIDFAANTTAGTLSVSAVNGCGTSTALTQNISLGTAPDPTGNIVVSTATVCQGASGVAYQVANTNGATSYNWSYSGTGATINGTGNSVTVDFANNATAGTLSVSAQNSCGSSTAQTVSIAVNNLPAAPRNFAVSTTTLCQGANGASYQVAAVIGATGYSWSYSGTGATINQNGNSATISFNNTATSGVLSVSAINSCGNGAPITLNITVNSLAGRPQNLSGSTSVCRGTPTTYSVTNVAGVTYTWTLPSGWSGTSNTSSINTIAGQNGGAIQVTARNSCGISQPAILQVIVNQLPTASLVPFAKQCASAGEITLTGGSPAGGVYAVNGTATPTFNPSLNGAGNYNITYTYTDGNGCSATASAVMIVSICAGVEDVSFADISLYPNPVDNMLNLNISESGIYNLAIYDALGRNVAKDELSIVSGGVATFNTAEIANGTYTIRITNQEGNSWNAKFIVKH